MASSSASGALRRAAAAATARLTASSKEATRKIQTSAPKCDGHGHANDPDAYIHAEKMYDIPAMTNRKLKFGLGVGGAVLFGTSVPLIAVWHQQIKARG